jgi:hypothetical protein
MNKKFVYQVGNNKKVTVFYCCIVNLFIPQVTRFEVLTVTLKIQVVWKLNVLSTGTLVSNVAEGRAV